MVVILAGREDRAPGVHRFLMPRRDADLISRR
jgi:hypothetical protein